MFMSPLNKQTFKECSNLTFFLDPYLLYSKSKVPMYIKNLSSPKSFKSQTDVAGLFLSFFVWLCLNNKSTYKIYVDYFSKYSVICLEEVYII